MAALSDDTANGWLKSLQSLINKTLGMDEETLQALQQLSGKVIFVDILNSDLHFYLLFNSKGVNIQPGIAGQADVRVRARLGSLLLMLFAKKGETAIPREMEIMGDVNLIQKFQTIMSEFDPDWEEPASRLLGDGITHTLARFIAAAKQSSLANRSHLMTEISEYIRFEKNIVPDATAVEAFNEAVDELRSEADLIEQRIEKLESANITESR